MLIMVPSFQLINVLYLQPWALFASSSSIDRTLSSDSWVQVLTHPHPHTHTHTNTHKHTHEQIYTNTSTLNQRQKIHNEKKTEMDRLVSNLASTFSYELNVSCTLMEN